MRDDVRSWVGLYVGHLDNQEIETFNRAVREGWAFRDYDHAAGFLGVAKLGVRNLGDPTRPAWTARPAPAPAQGEG